MVRSFAPGSFFPVSYCARQTAFAAVSVWPFGDLPSTVFATKMLPLERAGCGLPDCRDEFRAEARTGLRVERRQGPVGDRRHPYDRAFWRRPMFFREFYDEGLAQASYVVGCPESGEALVVDPRRDIQVYLD